ncbi:MAG TPA: hypothetical protein VMM38_07490 [Aridibacter sp.]|nr:hypothetical protein [Aridibacter sp.]
MPSKKFIFSVLTYIANCLLAVVLLFESLLVTSLPLAPHQESKVDSAIDVLRKQGFSREAFVLENVAIFRSSDNWLNSLVEKENAFASANLPFAILTIYPDFYTKTKDDTERSMILLHEARHILADNENQAYGFVWRNRARLGWTQMSHGTSETYTTVELQTREHVPEIFNCPDRLWSDCTELPIGKD